ncbi:hypothetical protein N1851_002653 [Merluccius polli]|uniref:Uncharacterized protein n=1 Tax=Merluccius polli TaxID=89951 RepID=A0AA47NAP6_MERPO|nr:hypothetical protein N1851_002653 [Merluccius polli]
MKRSYPSGAEKRRKKEETRNFTSKLQKVTNFFTVPAAAAGSSSSNPQPNETGMGCESSEIIQPGLDDVVPPDYETPASSTLLVSCQHGVLLEDDPALWPKQLSDSARCSIVQRGPLQVKDRIFPRN